MQADDPTLPLSPLPRPSPRRGEVLGRYFILHELGRGGMGVVYAAYDPELDRKVALKLLHPDREREDRGQARLLREAQALARLSHPNVIHVYDAGAVGDRVFMAMEMVQGESLDEWLARETPPWRQVLAVYRAAGQGLAAAHAAGLVHRDFKPSNVLLGDDGRVRVVDFGVARPADEAAAERSDLVMGTPRYMAPEVARGRAFDHRADQFSFCVALFESLYGIRPFGGDTLPDVLREVLAARVREVPRSRVPSWVRRILLRGLSADPEARYPSLDALLAELGQDRAAQIRRRAAAAAVLLALTASGAALYTAQRSEIRLCLDAGRKLAGVWDARRKEAVQHAFAASTRPYADDTWRSVERSLDAYTGAWTTMRKEACEATHRRGEQSAELLDLRIACLDRRLREVRALTRLFATGDPAVIERATQASLALPSLDECADPAALIAPVRPPTGEAARRALDQLNRRLADASSLRALGRYEASRAAAAAGIAARPAWPPLEAELLRARALAEDALGESETAEATLFQALAAAQRGRHDALATRIWTDLVWISGFQRKRFDEARRWARMAEASLARLGGPAENPEMDADLKGHLGAVLDLQGEHERGLALLRQALATYEKTLGPEHPNVNRTLNRIGAAYYQAGRHAEALAIFQHSLERIRRQLGPNHPTVAIRLGNLALALEGLGRYEEALRVQSDALTIEERALGPDHPRVAVTHGNLASLLMVLDHNEEALAHARRGLIIDRQNPETAPADLGVSYLIVADAMYRLGRYQWALDHNQQARELLAKSVGPHHPWTAKAEAGYGRILLAQGHPGEGAAALRRSLAAFQAAGEETVESADARFQLAQTLWKTGGDRAEALELAREAREWLLRHASHRKRDLAGIEDWLAARS